eukprot:PhF_6_TR41060/c0_g1_i1/m.62197
MPPKPKAKKAKGKKGKKGATDKHDEFEEVLNEMFYVSPEEKEKKRQDNLLKIRSAFKLFERDNNGTCDVKELGTIVRNLGFNPSEKQLKAMQEIVEDEETSSFIIASKFEKMMMDIFGTFEFKHKATRSQDAVANATEAAGVTTSSANVNEDGLQVDLLVRDDEDHILKAFVAVWEAKGKKTDGDKQRYVDSDALRDLVMSMGSEEMFNETEALDMINAAADPETGFIKEDYVTSLAHD